MELRHLRYFLAVAEEQSFSNAAKKLFIAQPSLSRQIQQLEEELGVELIERNKRPLTLTKAGHFVLSHAQKILAQTMQLKDVTRNLADKKKHYTIGIVASLLYGRLPEIVNEFKINNPHIEVHLIEMTTMEQNEALKKGEIDVGFGRLDIVDADIERKLLRREPLVLAIAKDHPCALFNTGKISLLDLIDDSIITYPKARRPNYTDLVLNVFSKLALKPSNIIETAELQTALGMVAINEGVCIVPEGVMRIKIDRVKYFPIQEIDIYSPIIMNYRLHEQSDELTAMKASIDKVYALFS